MGEHIFLANDMPHHWCFMRHADLSTSIVVCMLREQGRLRVGFLA